MMIPNVPHDPVPPRLERFMLTTARRDDVSRAVVALIVTHGPGIGLAEGDLPKQNVMGWQVGGALQELLGRYGLSAERPISYIGFRDRLESGMRIRQYHFLLRRACGHPGLEYVDAGRMQDVLTLRGSKKVLSAIACEGGRL